MPGTIASWCCLAGLHVPHILMPGLVHCDRGDAWPKLKPGRYDRAEILSWRRSKETQELLLEAKRDSNRWLLAHAQRGESDSSSAWKLPVIFDEPVAGVLELDHHPSDRDLAQIVAASWWIPIETMPKIEDWGVNQDAWVWATGNWASRELRAELERLKRYPWSPNAHSVANEKAATSGFVLVPGQDTELDVSTDGERLIITPLRAEANRKGRMARAQARKIANHERTFRKLAK